MAAMAVSAAEKPQPLSQARVDAIVAQAPDLTPRLAGLGLKLKLVDYINCADPKDPHGFMDQGTSRIVESKLGKVRVTAAHRHAFFAYRFRRAEKDAPHLIVWEYPDDDARTITFATHESGLSGRKNIDWSLETGVYTGDPLPNTHRMQLHTFIMWPQDQWPVALVGNWNRHGAPAAARRIWVFAIQGGLPRLAVNEPDPKRPRLLGGYYSFSLLPVKLLFGLRSPKAIEHMLDYYAYIGNNVLSWSVIWNNSWAFGCQIPAWDGGNKSEELDRVLEAMDKKGGMHFIASFALGGGFKVKGKRIDKMAPAELKAAIFQGFDQFLERYGKFKSLRGIALGAQFGIGFFDLLQAKGVAADLVAHIKKMRPDLLVQTYIGGKALHQQYFPDAWGVVSRWEEAQGAVPWSRHLGEEARKQWIAWKHDPGVLGRIQGLDVSEQYQPDDHRIFDTYAQQPRAMFYYDLDRSAARSKNLNTRCANIWDTHFEGWWGLWPGYNFWYKKLWVAPAYNAPPPYSLASWARVMEHRDRNVIVAGAWNGKQFGWEMPMRRFATAFRALPPDELKGVPVEGADTVIARWLAKGGKRYVSLLNVTPFGAKLRLDGQAVTLPPYELKTVVEEGKDAAPKLTAQPNPAYVKWVASRLTAYETLLHEVAALETQAAPAAFQKHLAAARKLWAAKKPGAASRALGAGLTQELKLRKRILTPPKIPAPKVAQAPPLNGKLDAWPKGASDLKAEDGGYLASHLYMPNSWSGPNDLSLRLRLAHDGTKLYVGAEVRDDVLEPLDGLTFVLSTNGAYRNWREKGQKYDLRWSIGLPVAKKELTGSGPKGFAYVCRRTKTGYVVEGSAPLAALGRKPGASLGFAVWISDGDKTRNLKRAGWARKSILLYPNRALFPYWSDARTCGELVLEK